MIMEILSGIVAVFLLSFVYVAMEEAFYRVKDMIKRGKEGER